MPVADLVQHLPWVGVGLGSDIARLVGIAPIERAAVETMAGGAGGLEDRSATRRVALDLAGIEIDHLVHVDKPLGQERRKVFDLFLRHHLLGVAVRIGAQQRHEVGRAAGIPHYPRNTGLIRA